MIDLFLLALIAGLVAVAYLLRSQKKKNLPPSPIGFPVIGHLYLLKEPVHRSLRDLSRNLGNMFFLRLGSRRAVVVTSASAFEEFLSQQNDIVFANRPMATINEYMTYNNTIVSTAPYGHHWRNLRKFQPKINLFVLQQTRHNKTRECFKLQITDLNVEGI